MKRIYVRMIATLTVLVPVIGAAASTESLVYSFARSNDGTDPTGGLITAPGGGFYGVTRLGGSTLCSTGFSGCGTVFKLSPPAAGQTQWSKKILHTFKGGTWDGAEPMSGLVADASGALYGTTVYGGGSGCQPSFGCGVIFRLTPPSSGQTSWTENVLYKFKGGEDGANPYAGMILDSNGVLYGTTYGGGGSGCGGSGCGLVFKLTPPAEGKTSWAESVLRRFKGGLYDGAIPIGGLMADANGHLYGTTLSGGVNICKDSTLGCGTVYRLTPPIAGQTKWSAKLIYKFHGPDGANPYAVLVKDASGSLYGTTGSGGSNCDFGTVFTLRPPLAGQTAWTESVLHSFQCPSHGDGTNPVSGLIIDANGKLYGTTGTGGRSRAGGVAPASPCCSKVNLDLNANSTVIEPETEAFNCHYQCGTVFELTPPTAGKTAWTETVLYNFVYPGRPDGYTPSSGLIADASGALYGMTEEGGEFTCVYSGITGCGTIFKLTP